MSMKKMLCFAAMSAFSFSLFSENTVIILYGCSSAGKTSISCELGKQLPGKWKVLGIDMFPAETPHGANIQLWQHTNKYLDQGYDVVVDTVISEYLFDKNKRKSFVVLTYCSPMALVEHVLKRNKSDIPHNHRKMKKVLRQFCRKYKATTKEDSIDVLRKSDLENATLGWWALRQIKKEYFTNNQHMVYLAARLASYDCLINTGKMSIQESVATIKRDFLKRA